MNGTYTLTGNKIFITSGEHELCKNIIHPDVRRNLLWMKSYVEGMRSFFYYASTYEIKAVLSNSTDERESCCDLFELLTPLIKDYLAVHAHEG